MRYVTVYKNYQSYSSFPYAVVLPSSEILVAFRVAGNWSADLARQNKLTHHDRESACFLTSSQDAGVTWTQPVPVYRGAYGINDPALTRLRDGTLLLHLNLIDVRLPDEKYLLHGQFLVTRDDIGTVSSLAGHHILSSRDDGATWSDSWTPEMSPLTHSVSRDAFVELPDGTLVFAVYESFPGPKERVWSIRSPDQGRTWSAPSLVAENESHNFNETSLLSLSGLRLLAMIRADVTYRTEGELMTVGGVGELYCAVSNDGGAHWSKPIPSGIWGQPAHLLRLPSGSILCTYGYRRKPYGVRACLSHDEGKTWDIQNDIVIRENCPTWDVGYPVTVRLPDATLATFYYWVDDEATRYVEGALWEFPR